MHSHGLNLKKDILEKPQIPPPLLSCPLFPSCLSAYISNCFSKSATERQWLLLCAAQWPWGDRKSTNDIHIQSQIDVKCRVPGRFTPQFVWLSVFPKNSGWLHMLLSDNGALRGSWMGFHNSHGWLGLCWVCLEWEKVVNKIRHLWLLSKYTTHLLTLNLKGKKMLMSLMGAFLYI